VNTLKTELEVFQHDPYIKRQLEEKTIAEQSAPDQSIPDQPAPKESVSDQSENNHEKDDKSGTAD